MKALLLTSLLYASLFLLLPSVLGLPLPLPRPESLEHLVESLIGVPGGHTPHQHFVQADDPGLHHRRDLHPDFARHPFAPWGDSPEGAPLLPRDEDWQPWIQSDNPDKFIRRDEEPAYPEGAAPILPRGVDATRLVYRRAPRPDQLSATEESYGQPWTGSTGSDNPDLNRRDDLSADGGSYGQPWAGSDNPNLNRRNDGVDATEAPIILDRDEDFRNHSPSPVLIHNPQSDGTSNGDDESDSANLKCQPGGPSAANSSKFAPTGLLRPTLSTIVKPNQPFLVMYCTPTYHAMRSMGWDVLAYNSNSTGMGRLLATGVKGDSTHVTVDDPYYDRLAVYERQNGVAGNMFAMATRNLVFDHGDGNGNGGQDGGQPKVTKQGITLAGAGVNAQGTPDKEATTVKSTLDEFSNNQHTKSDALAVHKGQQAMDEAAAAAEEHVKDATHKVKAAEKQVAHGQAPPSALKAANEAKHAAANAEQAALPESLKAVKDGEDAAQVAGQDVVGAAGKSA